MKKLHFYIFVLIFGLNSHLFAQYWVEFDPGACQVGPPPVCVVGHWHWVEVPEMPVNTPASDNQSEGRNFNKPSEISTDLEFESFSYDPGLTGQSSGLRALYERYLPSELFYGGRMTYDQSKSEYKTLDLEATSEATIFSGNLYLGKDVSEKFNKMVSGLLPALKFPYAQLTGGLFYTNYESESGGNKNEPLTSIGPFVNFSFNMFMAPFQFGGGLSYSVTKTNFEYESGRGSKSIDETTSTISMGFNGGRPLGDTMYGSAEIYLLKDGIKVIGAYLNRSMSDAFGLTVGYKKLFGLDNFSNSKITIGSNIRF